MKKGPPTHGQPLFDCIRLICGRLSLWPIHRWRLAAPSWRSIRPWTRHKHGRFSYPAARSKRTSWSTPNDRYCSRPADCKSSQCFQMLRRRPQPRQSVAGNQRTQRREGSLTCQADVDLGQLQLDPSDSRNSHFNDLTLYPQLFYNSKASDVGNDELTRQSSKQLGLLSFIRSPWT